MLYNFTLIYGSREYSLEAIEDDENFTMAKSVMYSTHPELNNNCDVTSIINGNDVTLVFRKRYSSNG